MNHKTPTDATKVTRVGWRVGEDKEALLSREWLVTNGLGGYASGTIVGAATRRYHGFLVAALPDPLGRTMMLNHLSEQARSADGTLYPLWGQEQRQTGLELHGAEHLQQFHLEMGQPVWTYKVGTVVFEKRLIMPHQQNTVHISYQLVEDPEGKGLRLSVRPSFHFRPHDAAVSEPIKGGYTLTSRGHGTTMQEIEVQGPSDVPSLKLWFLGQQPIFTVEHQRHEAVLYRMEAARGYEAQGELWGVGHFKAQLTKDAPVTLVASAESWQMAKALSPEAVRKYECLRRSRLVQMCGPAQQDPLNAELAIAADQFIIKPVGRVETAAEAHAAGEQLSTVIAGYHWFTDWGRDTMISLEGLTLVTGRFDEARWILHSFARHVREGLIPNLFPEGTAEGLYHTADATLWFFHALDRYLTYTDDLTTLQRLLPVMEDIVGWHQRGTAFSIKVDPEDGLLSQGQKGYQLTWMDAKCDGWVVTPRRGKAVEINALWYNALRNLAVWLRRIRGARAGDAIDAAADTVSNSFNKRFWYEDGSYLYDVVDVVDAEGDRKDSSLRPNQIFAVSLPHAVLEPTRWRAVVEAVRKHLVTPVGLRSLAPMAADYKPTYHGDLRTRDAAYHQGTVWSWLIGPYVDACLKLGQGPDQTAELLLGLRQHMGEACVGSVSEVFDAEPPFTPRGCVAQAWGVAELLRAGARVANAAKNVANKA